MYLGYEDQLDQLGINQGDIGFGPGQRLTSKCCLNSDNNGSELVDLSGANGLSNLISEGMAPLGAENNAQLTQIGQSFGNTWAVHRRTAPFQLEPQPEHGQPHHAVWPSVGLSSWGSNGAKTSTTTKTANTAVMPAEASRGDSLGLDRYYDDSRTDATYKWNALLNLSYKLNEFNKVSLMAMPNMTGTSSTRLQDGINPRDHDDFQQQITHRYEGRELNIFQARGEHFLPASETKIRWNASHAQGTSEHARFACLLQQLPRRRWRHHLQHQSELLPFSHALLPRLRTAPTSRCTWSSRWMCRGLRMPSSLQVQALCAPHVLTKRISLGLKATNQNLLNTVGGDLNAYFSQENFVVNPERRTT